MKQKHKDFLLGVVLLLSIIFVAAVFSLFAGCEEHHHRTVIVPSQPAPKRNTNINISPTIITPAPYYRTPTYYPAPVYVPAPYCPPPVVVTPCPPPHPAPCPEPHHPEPHHDHDHDHH